jgi:hypothetical protein
LRRLLRRLLQEGRSRQSRRLAGWGDDLRMRRGAAERGDGE